MLVSIVTSDNCTCGYYQEFDWVGPYCGHWGSGPPFCLLSGGHTAKMCPGAIQLGNLSLYWTVDAKVCEKSSNYIAQYCNCMYYEEYNWIGPFCSEWINETPPFCLLSGKATARFCPDAVKVSENIYLTANNATCERSSDYTVLHW